MIAVSSKRKRPFLPIELLIAPAAMYLLFCMIIPVAQLLMLSITAGDGSFSLSQFARIYHSGVYLQVLAITFRLAGWATLISVLVSYPIAYLMATSTERARANLTFWVLLPFWTSFLVRTFAWIVILGRDGPISSLVLHLGLMDTPPALMFNFTGVMVGLVHAVVPLCVMMMVSVMLGIDANLSKAAMTLGSRRGSAFWQIYFPLSFPGVAAGALLVFITCLGFFITPALLGGRRETTLTQVIIDQIQQMLDWPFAAALAVLLLFVTLIVFYIYDRIVGLSSLSGAGGAPMTVKVAGRGRSLSNLGFAMLSAISHISDRVGVLFERLLPKRNSSKKRRSRSMLWCCVGLLVSFLALPAFVMVPISFTEGTIVDWPPRGFSLQWYQAFIESPQWMAALTRSLIVATLTGLLAMVLGIPAAIALARGFRHRQTFILAFIVSPLIIPRIIIAVALFYVFAKLGLVGTNFGLVIGHTILALPYVVVTLVAVLKAYDERYDQAAWSLGANRLRALCLVTLPLVRTGVISAFLFAFITSLDELTIALFVTGGLNGTLPKQMWDDAILKVTPVVAAASTLLILFVTALILVTEWMKRRSHFEN